MSLIQDALRRQQQEANGGAAPVVPQSMPLAGTPPAETPPVAAAPSAGRPASSTKSVLGIILFCFLAAWLIVLGVLFFRKLTGRDHVGMDAAPAAGLARPGASAWMRWMRLVPGMAPAPDSIPVPAAPAPAAAAEPSETPIASPQVSGPAIPVPEMTAATSPAPTTAAAPASAPTNMPAEASVAPDQETTAAAAVPVAPAATLAPPAVPVVWPHLRLSAVFVSTAGNRAGARLNDRFYRVGETVDGAALVEVRSDGVLLRMGTETRYLKVGLSL